MLNQNRVFPLFFVVFAVACYCLIAGWLALFSFSLSDFVFEIDFFVLLSIAIFLTLFLASFWSFRVWLAVFPLVLFLVPNSVNDVFPFFNMGPDHEVASATFSTFTHIDIYFFSLIFHFFGRLFYESLEVGLRFLILFFVFLIFSFLYLFLSVRYLEDSQLLGLFLAGTYQVRYLFYGFIFFLMFEFVKHARVFVVALLVGLACLILESTVFSHTEGLSRISSGNFGVNVFANLLVFLVCFFVFSRTFFRGWLGLFFAFVLLSAIAVVFFSQTRIALVSLIFAMLFYLILRFSRNLSVMAKLSCFLVLLLAPLIFSFVYFFFNINYFQEVLGYNFISSLMTRHSLWSASLEIFSDNFLGVGNLIFNVLRYEYFKVAVLLDPHSDYFGFLVGYGVLGLGFYITFLVYSYFLVFKFSGQYFSSGYSYPFATFFALSVLSVSSLTNSNFQKHQFYILIIFVFVAGIKSVMSVGSDKIEN